MKTYTNDEVADRLRAAISMRENEIAVLRNSLTILDYSPMPVVTLTPDAKAPAKSAKSAKPAKSTKGKRGEMSAEGRARVAEAQRIRWAKVAKAKKAAARVLAAKAEAKAAARQKPAKKKVKVQAAAKPAPKPPAKPTPTPRLPPAKPVKPPVKTSAVRMSDSVQSPEAAA